MEKPLALTLLYTSNIRGDIHMLPRLYTFMQSLLPAQRQGTLLLDLGNACADEVWHCEITRGRSTLIVLDGMGYHVANVDSTLDPINRAKAEDVVTMGLVYAGRNWAYHIPPVTDETIQVTAHPIADDNLRLQIDLTPADMTQLDKRVLRLQDVSAGQVGVVQVDLTDNIPQLAGSTIHDLPANTPPNPTIVASVEFVESEARYFQKKQDES